MDVSSAILRLAQLLHRGGELMRLRESLIT
jgi:hypothetical protein